jgi:hypothetical protein
MIELVTRGGKRVGELTDDVGGTDSLIIKGEKITLADVYDSTELTKTFNSQVKEFQDATKNKDTTRASE